MKKQIPKKKFRSIVRLVLWVLLVQFILINISASIYAYKLSRFKEGPAPDDTNLRSNILKKTWRIFTGPKFYKTVVSADPTFPYVTVKLKTANGLILEAWHGKQDSTAKGTVILLHGLSGNKSGVMDEANEFRYLGYNVFLVDFRAHGNSKGKVTTIGVEEAEDAKLAYDYIVSAGEKNIFLWGQSMGAVVICKAVADYGLKPAGILLEMPFASLQKHLEGRARTLGFPNEPFGFLVTFWMGVERGFNGYAHKTTKYARKVNCPVLVQWGLKDTYVTRSEVESVFKNLASKAKKLVIFNNADHECLLRKDPGLWRNEVESFLQRNIN